MKQVELYAKVRYAVQIEGLSKRAAARRFGIDAKTVDKMLRFSVPPGYRRRKPPVRPKLVCAIGAGFCCGLSTVPSLAQPSPVPHALL